MPPSLAVSIEFDAPGTDMPNPDVVYGDFAHNIPILSFVNMMLTGGMILIITLVLLVITLNLSASFVVLVVGFHLLYW